MRQPTQPEWATICELFDDLVDLPEDTQAQRLARPEVDPFVAGQVGSMLRAGQTSGLLDGQGRPAPAWDDYASLAPATIVGPFRIERLIGRGGMGEVYLAARAEGFAQRVALKLLRPEAAGRAALFDAERALLASLEHPGIARLIDGGIAADGRPWMALEYVKGEEIDGWCAAHEASIGTRLGLFLEICDAVAYAHARLVVHRDLKPANILIDGEGRARLLDFGIARIVGEGAVEGTMTQALLTPDYAAPEQLENGPTTVATDVYALGAVLFELLTGQGPWRQGEASMPSIIRRILHEDPPVPSRFAADRGDAPVPPQSIAGDLDAIVLKAMRRDPAQRYDSVADLAADVRRHRTFLPVQARSGSAGYHLRRFVRRNRWGVAAAAAVLLALVAGAGGIAWQARQTAIERDIARAELRRAEAGFNAMTFMFRNASDAGRAGTTTAHDMLNASARNLIATLRPDSPDSADAVITLADLYFLTEDPAGGEAFLRAAMAARAGVNDPVATARLQQRRGQALASMGRAEEARALLNAADRVFARDPERFRAERQDVIGARAYMLRVAGDREAGVNLLASNLPEAELAYADNPRELLTRYANLSAHFLESSRLDEADALLAKAQRLADRTNSTASAPGIMVLVHRGSSRMRRGDPAGALAFYRRAASLRRELYGPSAGLGFDLMQTGWALLSLNRPAEALQVLDESVPMIATYLGARTAPGMLSALERVEALAGVGRTADAVAELARLEPLVTEGGRQTALYGMFLRVRAALRIAERRYADARADLATADAIFAAQGPAGVYPRSGLDRLRARIPAPAT